MKTPELPWDTDKAKLLDGVKKYVIGARKDCVEKRERHKESKPDDKQTIIMLGGKLKAFQQIIDKLEALKATHASKKEDKEPYTHEEAVKKLAKKMRRYIKIKT